MASLGPGKGHKTEGQTLCVAICNYTPTRCSRTSVLSLHHPLTVKHEISYKIICLRIPFNNISVGPQRCSRKGTPTLSLTVSVRLSACTCRGDFIGRLSRSFLFEIFDSPVLVNIGKIIHFTLFVVITDSVFCEEEAEVKETVDSRNRTIDHNRVSISPLKRGYVDRRYCQSIDRILNCLTVHVRTLACSVFFLGGGDCSQI